MMNNVIIPEYAYNMRYFVNHTLQNEEKHPLKCIFFLENLHNSEKSCTFAS